MDWLIVMTGAFLLDLCFGDPPGFPHPVRLIGGLIAKGEGLMRRLFPKTEKGELWAGFVFVAMILACTGISVLGILALTDRLNRWAAIGVRVALCYYLLAMKSLKTESMRVFYALQNGDVKEGRKAVSWIVGRDTENLSEEGVIKAAVETVAENCSDGVVAPLFYFMLGGPVLGYIYKAVNTMDSMIGYQNERYLFFGRFAAKLDDALNFIPARLAAHSMVAVAFLLGYDGKNAYRIYKRDRRNHKSPNSAQTEAVCAGALGIQLAGDAWYFGKKVEKPFIGDDARLVERLDICRANRLHYGACLLSALALGILKTAGTLRV